MPNANTLTEVVEDWDDKLFRLGSLWLLGDFLYAALPLVVLITITWLLHESFDHFLELKEWSFATIVLCGADIRRFVRLKVVIQQTPKSFKLDTGIQTHIVLLIVSVLVLTLVILAEKRFLPETMLPQLGRVQIALFCLASVSVLIGIVYEERDTRWAERLSDRLTQQTLLTLSLRDLDEANRLTQYVSYALENSHLCTNSIDAASDSPKQIVSLHRQHISLVLDQLENAIAQTRQRLPAL